MSCQEEVFSETQRTLRPERAVARKFGRSRAIVSRLKNRYDIQSPATPALAPPTKEGAGATTEGNQLSRRIRRELAAVDRETLRWWRSLTDEERDEIVRRGPDEKPAACDPSFLDPSLGAFEESLAEAPEKSQ